ncbi:MAG: hypothetical protein A3J83_04375 [Elusimicrobia bacterium RIFOXYA2_FULL_40_6]|nr:MAG: hypothetical protein A3J83_04375 [Elusimicrobia bacterium RIFOXYA2_FULL_40_6]
MKKLIFVVFLFTQAAYSNAAANTGADFLKIGVGARSAGLGNAFTAIANDATAINWNAGGLSQVKQKEVVAMHSQWIADTNLDYIGFGVPVRNAVIGASLVCLSQSGLEGRDANGAQTDDFGASDLAVTFSYSRQVKLNANKVGLGINMKMLRQQIASDQAYGVAFDMGALYYTKSMPLSFGLSLQNIGTQMKFIDEAYNLPLSVTAGVGYNVGYVTIGLDVKQELYENKTTISMGTEFTPINTLAIRAGYLMNQAISTGNTADTLNGLGAGLGINLLGMKTDYSFVPYGALGNTHKISFSSKF